MLSGIVVTTLLFLFGGGLIYAATHQDKMIELEDRALTRFADALRRRYMEPENELHSEDEDI